MFPAFSVALAAAPVELAVPGQKQELALGDWTGVIQSNPQNNPGAASGGYLAVETTAYPQGVAITTSDSAYVLDAAKEYTLEIKMRTAAAGTSYYRVYCAGGAPSGFSGDYEVKPATWVPSGFLVEGGDWVVVTSAVTAGAEGQLGIKIHGGAVGDATYGDSFDVDYVKVYEKLTENVIFFEDFEDEEFNCTYNAINGAVGAAVKGE